MDTVLKEHVSSRPVWTKGLYILLFAILYNIAEIVIVAVVIFQFFITLFTGENNGRLLRFGHSLSTYIYEVMRFITFNSDERPYPFGAWPGEDNASEDELIAEEEEVLDQASEKQTGHQDDKQAQ